MVSKAKCSLVPPCPTQEIVVAMCFICACGTPSLTTESMP
jgi:hypothetical protein